MAGLRVAVSATFTADPIQESLSFLLGLCGWSVSVEFAPFGQVFQTLLDGNGLFAQNRDGVSLVIARRTDFPSSDAVAELVNALLGRVAKTTPLFVVLCPSDETAEDQQFESALEKNLGSSPGIRVLSSSSWESLYPVEKKFDPEADRLGAIPYTTEFFTALGAASARAIHRGRVAPFKVIALDCDGTLWSGICGEDGPAEVRLDEPRRALQTFMRTQRDHGRLLTIISKNNSADVEETFRVHPEMPLQLQDFAATEINWDDKGSGLSRLAARLQLGLDSFVFIDDNPKEVAEVQAELPRVVALTLPPEVSEIPSFLEHVWALDLPDIVTEEDRQRTEAYAAQAERHAWEREALTLEQFIAGLELLVEIEPLREDEFPRAVQLTIRTNQMNFSSRRYTEASLREFLRHGHGFAVRARDRFGDYGFVGLMLLEESENALLIDTFLLSCRALGRGVEQQMLNRIGLIAMERGNDEVVPLFEPTSRNTPAQELLASITDVTPWGLATLAYRPEMRSTGASVTPSEPASLTHHAANYQRLAELNSVSKILSAIRKEKRPLQEPADAGGEIRSDLEQKLCAMWVELLGVPSVRLYDNFFDLGGHSLLAVQLVARLHRELGIDLPLEAVYTGTLTVSELARSIESLGIGELPPDEYASLLAEIENLTDEEAEALLARELGGEPRP